MCYGIAIKYWRSAWTNLWFYSINYVKGKIRDCFSYIVN